ncbi:hypothetical protein LTR78_007728 [Recurvomyces mirabilis]|uniref:GP-PDE domain-containing protein n=1 Tax=Recurvomyces mirabilis TaxID=574656 RepID=A0AAE0WI04_9PEZI|nr:hypothetical protein LTR78_007728 [Recurvomyces mirabilis]KAK5151615.1 hypothetical protein LTS14_009102 [Recurvomyces mirabilis]
MASTATEREPLLRRVPSALAPPPMLVQPGIEKLDTPVTMAEDTVFPVPTFTTARLNARQRRLPQCIAHRGYKAKFPENTLASFKGAVKAGAHALETDVHISKDEVVVLSHDPTLKRCYGRQDKIIDLTWDELKDVRTVAEPHEPMPRLKDMLEYLAQPGMEEVWLLLDIKLSNDADAIMRLMASTIASVPAPATKKWNERIVLGIWAAKYLPLAQKYFEGFPVMHIGFSTSYASHFFTIPNVGFNMLFPTLVAPGGRRFLREAREKYHRKVIAWTVNTEERMEWCIRRELDGVITDDPAVFLEVCKRHDESKRESMMRVKDYLDIYRLWIWITLALLFFRKRFQPVASQTLIEKKPQAKL